MSLRQFSFAVLLSSAAIAAPAQAATFLVTYTSTVLSGYDMAGIFGTATTDLAGLSYKSVYTLTAPTPGALTADDGINGYTVGGEAYGTPSPVSGKITINGVTHAVGGTHAGVANQIDGYSTVIGFDQVNHLAQDFGDDGISARTYYVQDQIYSFVNDIVNSSDYTAPLDYTVQSGDSPSGEFGFLNFDYGSSNYTAYTVGSLAPTRVTIALAGAVPEPATWAMMIAGFGLTGGMMRVRRKTNAPAVA